jgi:VWFA-related protein
MLALRRHAFLVPMLLSAASLGIGALPDPPPVVLPPVLEITTVARVVDVYAVVTDRGGRLVTGLDREAFDLREDGVSQDITLFGRETDAPLSLGLVVDTSASQAALLPAERARAASFLEGVLRPGDEAFVMGFDREVRVLQSFTAAPVALSRGLQGLRIDRGVVATRGAPRGTRLFDAIREASDLMEGRRGRKVVVLLTDGEDQGSHVSRREALAAAARSGVMVYSVVVADPAFYWGRGRDYRGEEHLAALLRETGGWLVRPDAGEGLDAIAAELRAQYRLGYSPRRGYDGTYRRVQVRVRGRGYLVRARTGYFASPE